MTEDQTGRKISNEERKREKLIREINRAHDWRVQVWAQCELRIRSANASLEALGGQPVEPFMPDFKEKSELDHYSTMSLSR